MYLGYFTFLTRLFCLQGDLEKTAQVEGCVIDCLIAMVMKLSEVTFRPLFFKVTPPCLGFSRRPSFPPCGDNCVSVRLSRSSSTGANRSVKIVC